LRNPRTKYKRSKNVFAVASIALSLSRIGPRLLQLFAQSLIGSPGTLLLNDQLDCPSVPEAELQGFQHRVLFHQAFKSAGYDDVDQLIEGVALGDRSVVTEEFWVSGIFA